MITVITVITSQTRTREYLLIRVAIRYGPQRKGLGSDAPEQHPFKIIEQITYYVFIFLSKCVMLLNVDRVVQK